MRCSVLWTLSSQIVQAYRSIRQCWHLVLPCCKGQQQTAVLALRPWWDLYFYIWAEMTVHVRSSQFVLKIYSLHVKWAKTLWKSWVSAKRWHVIQIKRKTKKQSRVKPWPVFIWRDLVWWPWGPRATGSMSAWGLEVGQYALKKEAAIWSARSDWH